MRVLRSINCKAGTVLLNEVEKRSFVKELAGRAPDLFKQRLRDSQCEFISFLAEEDIGIMEAGNILRKSFAKLGKIFGDEEIEWILDYCTRRNIGDWL